MKTVALSETSQARYLKGGSCSRQLIGFMKICEYPRSVSFLDLDPTSFVYETRTPRRSISHLHLVK